jgi:TFIIF-interacting CTD phosphatase-like protein
LKIPNENVLELVKDISRFQNRNLKRSILMDPKMTSFILTPDNGYPVMPYTAEYDKVGPGGIEIEKDEYLKMIIDELEYMKNLPDVRPYLQESFRIRQTLKSAKLI